MSYLLRVVSLHSYFDIEIGCITDIVQYCNIWAETEQRKSSWRNGLCCGFRINVMILCRLIIFNFIHLLCDPRVSGQASLQFDTFKGDESMFSSRSWVDGQCRNSKSGPCFKVQNFNKRPFSFDISSQFYFQSPTCFSLSLQFLISILLEAISPPKRVSVLERIKKGRQHSINLPRTMGRDQDAGQL